MQRPIRETWLSMKGVERTKNDLHTSGRPWVDIQDEVRPVYEPEDKGVERTKGSRGPRTVTSLPGLIGDRTYERIEGPKAREK